MQLNDMVSFYAWNVRTIVDFYLFSNNHNDQNNEKLS